MRFCPKCGAELKESSKFCPKCGAKVSAPEMPKPEMQKPAAPAHKAPKYEAADIGQRPAPPKPAKPVAPREPEKKKGLPVPAMIAIGLAAVAVGGGAAFFISGAMSRLGADKAETEISAEVESKEQGGIKVTEASEPSELKMTESSAEQISETTEAFEIAESETEKALSDTSIIRPGSALYVANCNESITLRSTPETSGNEITQIPLYGTVEFVTEGPNGFYQVSYNGRTGYALSEYLSTATPEINTGITGYVVNCNESITLRTEPDTSGNEICQIPLGESVSIIKGSGDFYLVSYRGDVGYVLSSYISTSASANQSAVSETSGVQQPQTSAAVVSEGDYILPDSSSRPLTQSDLAGLSKEELRLARNEIYARHGRKFDDETLKDYFGQKSWYRPTIEANRFSEDLLSQLEKDNIKMIQAAEDR